MAKAIKGDLADMLESLIGSLPQPKDKATDLLMYTFALQELEDLVSTELKEAWENNVTEKVTLSDEDMRDEGIGEHIVTEAGRYSVVATVGEPQKRFSLEVFLTKLVKKHKLKLVDLVKLADTCKIKGDTNTLKKRVLEA